MTQAPPPPTPRRLLRTWLLLGTQSFGGGPALLFLIRRTFVEEYRWLSDAEFVRIYALSQITPGVNLLAITILLGWRFGGLVGMLLSLLGLLLPSVTITIGLTALYTSVRHLGGVQAALHGIIPATAGLMLLLTISTGWPFLRASWRAGRRSLLLSSAIILGSALLVGLAGVPVVGVLLLAGGVGAYARWRWPASTAPTAAPAGPAAPAAPDGSIGQRRG